LMLRPPPRSPLFPYTTLFRSRSGGGDARALRVASRIAARYAVRRTSFTKGRSPRTATPDVSTPRPRVVRGLLPDGFRDARRANRSEEHTSELQSLRHLVCRLL